MCGESVKMSLSPGPGPQRSFPSPDRLLLAPGRGRFALGFLLALVGPLLVTVAGTATVDRGTAVPALLYLLAVVGVAVVGRLWPGLLAAVLSFAGLDYYFTPPHHTFDVAKAEDLFALGVFLVVAVAVSAAISAALQQREKAERGERQVRALYNLTALLMTGSGLASVLADVAAALRVLFGAASCRVLLAAGPAGEEEVRATAGPWTATDGGTTPGSGAEPDTLRVALTAEGRRIGTIELAGPVVDQIGRSERAVLDAFAAQLALAVERARLGEEASAARVEAEASRIRAALFSSVTHDLRTPLASITASASSLLEEGVPFTEEQRGELLKTIFEESQRLNRLVGNLMDISRMRAGALLPTVEEIPFEDLVSSVLQRLRDRLAGREIRVQIREPLPPASLDVMQMDQVLTNLVENALRYSPAGSPIAISAGRWEHLLEVRVADRGPGIPAEERARVFEEFYRRDVDGQKGGTGLGLAIARAVVQAHGGTIWIEDTPGGGATVGFRLPLPREPA
jgi:two-component system sensor histidine kinase KdpD